MAPSDLQFVSLQLPQPEGQTRSSEASPFLPSQKTRLPPLTECDPERAAPVPPGSGLGTGWGGSVGGAMFNLSNTVVGAGIMGLPAILKVLGIPLGLLTFVLVGLLTEYTLQILLRSSAAARVWTLDDLVAGTYGLLGRLGLRVLIIIHNIGILVVYLLVIGDVFCGSDSGSQHFPGLLEEWAGGPAWWNRRALVLLVSMATVIGPLVALPEMDSLQFTSGLSILLAMVFVLVTIVITAFNLSQGGIDFSRLHWLPPGLGATPLDVLQLFAVIPTVATAFTCHYNLHPIYAELHPPREEKMQNAIRRTMALCTTTYCVTALFGYLLFGESTYPDVLVNFNRDLNMPFAHVISNVVRLAYALHLMLVFPVIHFSLRASLDGLLFPQSPPLSKDGPRFIGITVFLLGIILMYSLTVPDIQFAFQFVGAAGVATLAFTLPGFIAMSDEAGDSDNSRFDRKMGPFLIAFGVTITVTGLACNFHKFSFSFQY